jgi:FtsP/CotA-like multicopper oxidase with cupredoxin domain
VIDDPRLRVPIFDSGLAGPLIEITRGAPLTIAVENSSTSSFRFAVQGLRGKALSGSDTAILPGETRTIGITPPDAGMFVYRASAPDKILQFLAGPLLVTAQERPVASQGIVVTVNTLQADGKRTVLVNGMPELTAGAKPGDRIRLHVANLAPASLTGLVLPEGTQVIAIDGQPCEPFPPLNNALFLPPLGRTDVAFDMPAKAVIVADALDPDRALVTITPEGESGEPEVYAARLDDNKNLPAEIPLQSAARKTWKPGAEIADPLVKVRSGRSVVLTFENDATPRAILLEGHNARHLDTLDDGWKPWWQDTHLLHPAETARLAFIAEQAGRYAVEIIPLEGGGRAETLWLEVLP